MHLLCPHCGNAIHVIDLTTGEGIVCLSCGSSFKTECDSTTTWKPKGRKAGFEIISTAGAGAFGKAWRWCRRNPLASSASIAMAAVLGIAFVSLLYARKQAQRANTLRDQQSVLQAALGNAANERQRADERARVTQRRLAENSLDHGLSLCEQGDIAAGILWLARSVTEAPRDEEDLQRLIRINLNAHCARLPHIRQLFSHRAGVSRVAFSPDGKTVLTAGADMSAQLWETATGQPLTAPLQHQGLVDALAFSPDGKSVLTGSADMTARLWDASTGKSLALPLRHQDIVSAVAFSPDGKIVLTGSQDKTARLCEAATGKFLGPPLQHQGAVWAVAFSPDGKTVVTGSDDKTARLWDAATGKPLVSPLTHQSGVSAVAFSPDGKKVLTGSNVIRLWDVGTGKPLASYSAGVVRAAFSCDGKTALTANFDKTAQVWAAATGKPLCSPLKHQAQIWAVAISPDSKTVLTGSDKTATLWETATGELLTAPLTHAAPVRCVAFSPDGTTVLTGSDDKTAKLWEAGAKKPLIPLPMEGAPEQISLRVSVLTGLQLDKGGGVQALDSQTWRTRRQQLAELDKNFSPPRFTWASSPK
jgi:WD40 repeat protein